MVQWNKGLRSVLLAIGSVASAVVVAQTNLASDQKEDAYPQQPVRLVSCCAGIVEAVARVMSDEMQRNFPEPFIVQTIPGASGMIGASYVARSKSDGYTLFFGSNSTHAANQSLFKHVPYHYLRDFKPVAGVGGGPVVLVVPPDSPVRSIADLTQAAKKNPGKLTYGWASSATRVSMEHYKQLAKINIMGVPYKTNPQATMDLIGGRINVMFADTSTGVPLINEGRLRALAVSGKARMASLPNVPTMDEAGVKDYSLGWWVAIWAPANTPDAIVSRINHLVKQALNSPKVQRYFQVIGLIPMPLSPKQLQQFEVTEHDKWANIISTAGIKPE